MNLKTTAIQCLLTLGLICASHLTYAADTVIPLNCKEIPAADIGLAEGETTNNIKINTGTKLVIQSFNCTKTYADTDGRTWNGAYSSYLLSWHTASGKQDEFFFSDPKKNDTSGTVGIFFNKVDAQNFVINEYEERGGFIYLVHRKGLGDYVFLKQRYTSGDEDGLCFAKSKADQIAVRRCYWDEKKQRSQFFGKHTLKINIQDNGLKIANPTELKYFDNWDYLTRRRF